MRKFCESENIAKAYIALYNIYRLRFHARAVILQTYVAVPDRPSNRGALRGGPETLENLVRVGVLCPGGTQPGA